MPPQLRTTDRILVTGRTGTGKSYLTRRIFEATPPPRILVDPKHEIHTSYAVTFADPDRLPPAPVLRFTPNDALDLDAYDRLYRNIYQAGGWFVWLDEARIAAPPAGAAPRGVLQVIVQGRSRGIGHIALAQRPVWIAQELLSEAAHLMCFATDHPNDLDRLAAVMGQSPKHLSSLLRGMPPYGFAWYAARARTITICPPIRGGDPISLQDPSRPTSGETSSPPPGSSVSSG